MRSRRGLWAQLVVAGLLTAVLAIAGIAPLVDLAARSGTGSLGGNIAAAAFLFALCALCGWWAVHLEHQLRGHPPVRRQPRGPGPRRPRQRRNGPVMLAVITAFWTLVTVMVTALTVHSYDQGAESGYVQAHGVARAATVLSVVTEVHHGRSSDWYTSETTVSLAAPVAGQATTVVDSPHRVSYRSGERVTVLVDARNPGYAEIPGQRTTEGWEWLIFGALALVTVVFEVFLLRAVAILVLRRLRGRQWLPEPGA